MGKRSDFERRDRDFYETPELAVLPLLPHINDIVEYIEPCAGAGKLVDILEKHGKKCFLASDIEPQREDVIQKDMYSICEPSEIITNPPWDTKMLHPMLDMIINTNSSAWLLFYADWMHTKQSAKYMKYCHKIVSVGRVKWFPDSKMTGKDNCAWYQFKGTQAELTEFIGR